METLNDIANPAHASADLEGQASRVIGQLHEVVADIQSFFNEFSGCVQQQLDALAQQKRVAAEEYFEPTGQADDDAARAEFEQQMQQQVQMLEEAWIRLEEEQRSLLQRKEGTAPGRAPNANAVSSNPISSTQQPRSAAKSHQSAVHDFERLRHEIQMGRQGRK